MLFSADRQPKSTKGIKRSRICAKSNAILMRLLLDGTRDCYELAEETGLAYRSITDYCAALRKEGAVHVAGWSEDAAGGRRLAIYKLGVGKDVPQPRFTPAERAQRHRDRKTAARKALMGDAWSAAILNVQATSRAYLRVGQPSG